MIEHCDDPGCEQCNLAQDQLERKETDFYSVMKEPHRKFCEYGLIWAKQQSGKRYVAVNPRNAKPETKEERNERIEAAQWLQNRAIIRSGLCNRKQKINPLQIWFGRLLNLFPGRVINSIPEKIWRFGNPIQHARY